MVPGGTRRAAVDVFGAVGGTSRITRSLTVALLPRRASRALLKRFPPARVRYHQWEGLRARPQHDRECPVSFRRAAINPQVVDQSKVVGSPLAVASLLAVRPLSDSPRHRTARTGLHAPTDSQQEGRRHCFRAGFDRSKQMRSSHRADCVFVGNSLKVLEKYSPTWGFDRWERLAILDQAGFTSWRGMACCETLIFDL